jgi:hypothetical protein
MTLVLTERMTRPVTSCKFRLATDQVQLPSPDALFHHFYDIIEVFIGVKTL